MTLRRSLSLGSAALLVVALLAACFPVLPGAGSPPGTGSGTEGGTASDLAGTTWSGTDSDGDDWELEFQADGTVAVAFNGGSRFDDASDTWTLSGTTLDIHLVFVESDYDFAGPYDGGASIPLDGTWAGGGFTLTITRG
jgi:hypothetical protein